MQLLDRHLAFQAGDDDVSVLGSQRPVHHQDIAGIDASLDHGLSLNTHEECGRRMLDAELVQIDGFLNVVLRRRWEASRDPFQKHRNVQAGEGFKVTKQNAGHALHRILFEYTVFWRDNTVGSTHHWAQCSILGLVQLPGRREESV